MEVDGVKSFEYVEMDCPNPRAAQAGRLNKSASEVWKSTVQMNSVNLPGGAPYSCWDDVLWNLVCYPLLPLSLEPTPSNSPPPCVLALTLSPFPVYIPFLSSPPPPPFPPLSRSQFICPLPLHLFLSSSDCMEPETKQAPSQREAAGTVDIYTQLPPTISSLLPPPPPSCQPQFT